MPEKTRQTRLNGHDKPVTVTTFKSAAASVIVIIGNSIFFNYTSHLPEVIITMQKSMFEIKCSDCGETAMVPFKPTAGKPAYCRTCFSKHRFTQSEGVSKTNGFEPKQAWARRRECTQKKTRLLTSLFYSNGRIAHLTKKLFRQNEKNEGDAGLN